MNLKLNMPSGLICNLFLVFSLSVHGQADCKLLFSYRCKVASKTWDIRGITVPTTTFMLDYSDKNDSGSFHFLTLKDSLIDEKMISHLSSDFCMPLDSIVKKVFKRKDYTVRIFEKQKDHAGKYKMMEIQVPVDKIKFIGEVLEGRTNLIIQLPDLKI